MKNVQFLCLFLFLCSCTVHISTGDLPGLKGTWEGMYVVKNMHYHSTLKIYNDSLPLKGNLTIDSSPGKKPDSYPFENGEIDSLGRLIIRFNDEMRLDLALVQEYMQFKLDGTLSRAEKSGMIALLKIE